MWSLIYNMLPDVSGILLAAIGVALVVAPDVMSKLRPVVRSTLAILLVILGIAGLRSSVVQHREDNKEKAELKGDLHDVKNKVDTFGPKLDAIIAHPNSEEQRLLAVQLRKEINPKIEIEEPIPTNSDPTLLNATATNVGGSVAKGKVDTVASRLAVRGRAEENDFFQYLYRHEEDSDVKKYDIAPGYANRVIIPLRLSPMSPADLPEFKAGTKVIYVGILETYYNEQGRKFHTEKCMYLQSGSSLPMHCGTHNKID
jgi:hypothetical protein